MRTHDDPFRIGVALGGGSARGYAHIGALQSLERHGLAPDVIVGTSFGALVGALYATGRDLRGIARDAEMLRRRDVFLQVADVGLHRGALFSGERLEKYFDHMLEGRTFADLQRELAVVATDVATGERVLLRQGSLARAIRASSSLPGLFAPVEIGERSLIDGGIGSPIPLSTLEGLGVDVALGIGVGIERERSASISVARRLLASPVGRGVHGFLGSRGAGSALGRLGRALALTADAWTADGAAAQGIEVHTRPPIDWFCFHQAGTAIAAGAAAVDRAAPSILAQRAGRFAAG